MNRWQEMVAEFHLKFGIPARSPSDGWQKPRCTLRADLIDEESCEAIGALNAGNMSGVLKELCDTIYVCIGTAVEMGIDLEPMFSEVHASNMTKTGGFRGDGKLLKGENWQPPRIAEMLKALP